LDQKSFGNAQRKTASITAGRFIVGIDASAERKFWLCVENATNKVCWARYYATICN